MSNNDMVSEILKHYAIGEILDLERIEYGYVNQTWLVKTSTHCCVLKCRKPESFLGDKVRAQQALLEHLSHAGFVSPQVIRTRDNTSFVTLDNTFYELYAYISGVISDCTDVAHLKAAARTLGDYHKRVNGFKHPFFSRDHGCYTPERLKCILEPLLSKEEIRYNGQGSRIWKRLTSHFQDLQVKLDNLDTLPHLVIHGDYWSENIIFKDNKVVGVVDYDNAHECARVQEVAEAMIYFGRDNSGGFQHIVYAGPLNMQTAQQFLDAYANIIMLTDKEIKALPHLMRTIWLCASLNPPLKPRLRLDKDRKALLELLDLADWALDHSQEIIHLGFDIYKEI